MPTTLSTTKSADATATAEIKTVVQSAFWDNLEKSRFGYMPMILLVIAVLGGLAAAFALKMNIWALFAVVFPTIICFCFMLAMMPMRVIIRTAAVAVVIDLVLVTIGTFI